MKLFSMFNRIRVVIINKLKNMKNIYIVGAVFLIVGLGAGYLLTAQKNNSLSQGNKNSASEMKKESGSGEGKMINQKNCLADDCLLTDVEYPAGELSVEVKKALEDAIDDEYKAFSTYQAVIEEFGMKRPFSMIIRAEESHIASLKSLFDKYGLEIPKNAWLEKVSAPASIKEACQIGVEAEIANAKLYKEELLPAVKNYSDITNVFNNLMDASQEKHLPAFERCN